MNTHNVTYIPRDTPSGYSPSASAQDRNELALPKCGEGSLLLAVSGGAAVSGSLRHMMNYPRGQDQNMEGTPQNVHDVTNRSTMEESGNPALLATTEATWNKELETGESNGVQGEGEFGITVQEPG
jgi:hypothetical protein